MGNGSAPPGPVGIDNHYPWGPDPCDLFRAFVRNAAFYEMPVAFLQRVGRDYTFHFTAAAGPFAGEHTNVWLNYMILDQRTFRALIDLSTDRIGSGSQIGTAYHEATHAYLDLRESEPAFARAIRDGVEHYRDAPMSNGSTAHDPSRLFQEAAASYVGVRAANWWMVFQMLSKLASTVPSDDIVRQRYRTLAAKQRLDYNAAMRQRVFGYEEKSAISSEQIETTRPISDAMKTFLDHELLEDKIPDDFDAVAKFRMLMSEIK